MSDESSVFVMTEWPKAMSDRLKYLAMARWGSEGNYILQRYLRALRGDTPEKKFAHLEDLWTRDFPDAIAHEANEEIARQFGEEKKAIDAACAADIAQLQKEFEKRKAERETMRKAEIAALQQIGRTKKETVIDAQKLRACEQSMHLAN